MPSSAKKLACLSLLLFTGQLSWGFALLGPINEPYQVGEIGYALGGDIGAPKNIGEEYRRNTPVLYYSYDANFLDYFGSNGVVAVDSGVGVFNSLPSMSQMSSNLVEFPTQTTRENYLAETLNLTDMKSWTMVTLAEQLGLAEPERYVWTLRDRFQFPGPVTCPFLMGYLVVQRNFDPIMTPQNQLLPSSYVNGTLYSYFILETCVAPNPIAVTIPFSVDPLDFSFTSVAGVGNFSGAVVGANIGGLAPGRFFLGLTRDDAGGLRYLYRTNLMNFESTGPNTLASVTNPVPQLLFTSNLTQLAQLALTNDPVTLATLVPNLNIINSSNYFVNVLVTNFTAFFTNQPWMPVGSTVLMFATNVVPTIQTRFVHTFGNLLLLRFVNGQPTLVPVTQLPLPNGRSFVTIETDTVGTIASPFGPVGAVTVTTNSTFTTFLTNSVVGDYVILPTNLCSVDILGTQLTFVTQTTNFLGSATNSLTITNTAGFTNAGTVLQISLSQINYFTNHAFVVLPVTCVASNLSIFQGIDNIRFVRRDFDSLLGRFFTPFTNFYSLNSITNSQLVPQPIQRIITGPDILFTAQDLDANPDSIPTAPVLARNINFNTNSEGVGLAGPGTIEPFTTVIWNKGAPTYGNTSPNAFFESTAEPGQITVRILAYFDATTNAPIVFPNGASLVNLENEILIGITPGRLAVGHLGVDYGTGTNTFNATGGIAPYTWTLAPNSPGLPPGLFLLPDGTLGGTPTTEGTYDFTIRLADANGRTVDRGYFISIIP
jgi:hypothetical protein